MANEDKTLPYTLVVEESQKELLPDNQLGLSASQLGNTQQDPQTVPPVQAGEDVPAGQAERTPDRATQYPVSDSAEKRVEAELEASLDRHEKNEKKLEAEFEASMAELQVAAQELNAGFAGFKNAAQVLDAKFKDAMEVSPMKMDDFEHNKVECQKCGETVFPHEAQVRGKMTWWCNTCNATMKSLRSRLSWPPNGFETLPEAEKKTFFAKVKEMKETDGEVGYKRIRDLVVRSMCSKRIDELMKERGGTYLPISVYAKKLACIQQFFFEDFALKGGLRQRPFGLLFFSLLPFDVFFLQCFEISQAGLQHPEHLEERTKRVQRNLGRGHLSSAPGQSFRARSAPTL